MKKILITGAAGFIGFHLSKRLLNLGYEVIGLDNLNDYYDIQLKLDRLKQLGINAEYLRPSESIKATSNKFEFFKVAIEDTVNVKKIFEDNNVEYVINLAAQAGVRYSIKNPEVYAKSNLMGFFNLLENCRSYSVKHLIYASSSSVYGNSTDVPFDESNSDVNKPVSFYAATKRCNEILAESYNNLYNIKMTALRFFTVYGPWGRPDMAMFLFTDAIIKNKPLKVFNNGNLSRDFTYIDDVIDGIVKVIIDSDEQSEHEIFNIGNNAPIKLLDFILEIEKKLERVGKKQFMPMQEGDVEKTWANTNKLNNKFYFSPKTPISDGVSKFIDWYKLYYKI